MIYKVSSGTLNLCSLTQSVNVVFLHFPDSLRHCIITRAHAASRYCFWRCLSVCASVRRKYQKLQVGNRCNFVGTEDAYGRSRRTLEVVGSWRYLTFTFDLESCLLWPLVVNIHRVLSTTDVTILQSRLNNKMSSNHASEIPYNKYISDLMSYSENGKMTPFCNLRYDPCIYNFNKC